MLLHKLQRIQRQRRATVAAVAPAAVPATAGNGTVHTIQVGMNGPRFHTFIHHSCSWRHGPVHVQSKESLPFHSLRSPILATRWLVASHLVSTPQPLPMSLLEIIHPSWSWLTTRLQSGLTAVKQVTAHKEWCLRSIQLQQSHSPHSKPQQ